MSPPPKVLHRGGVTIVTQTPKVLHRDNCHPRGGDNCHPPQSIAQGGGGVTIVTPPPKYCTGGG